MAEQVIDIRERIEKMRIKFEDDHKSDIHDEPNLEKCHQMLNEYVAQEQTEAIPTPKEKEPKTSQKEVVEATSADSELTEKVSSSQAMELTEKIPVSELTEKRNFL